MDSSSSSSNDLSRQTELDNQLIGAIFSGNIDDLFTLIDSGANVNVVPVTEHGITALMWASKCGHAAIVSALIDAGANVNAVDSFGFTALTRVNTNDGLTIVAALIEAGANLDADPQKRFIPKLKRMLQNCDQEKAFRLCHAILARKSSPSPLSVDLIPFIPQHIRASYNQAITPYTTELNNVFSALEGFLPNELKTLIVTYSETTTPSWIGNSKEELFNALRHSNRAFILSNNLTQANRSSLAATPAEKPLLEQEAPSKKARRD